MSVPDFPLRGLHDGAEYMLQNGVRGYAIEPIYLSDLKIHPVDYSAACAAGIRVVVRLSYSYARDSQGGQGTFPTLDKQTAFEQAAIQTIKASKGVAAWVIGNEPNRKAEWPADDAPVTSDQVVSIYNAIYAPLPLGEACPVSPPAIDPTNFESGDPLAYFQAILAGIHGAERFALHAYGYGASEPIDSDARFQPPMEWQYYGFRMWEPFASELYGSRYRETPILITESNHLTRKDGSMGWDDDAGLWIEDAYEYVAGWNAGPGSQYVHCLALYRYQGDAWALADKPGLLGVWQECGEQPIAGGPLPPPPPPAAQVIDVSYHQGGIDWQAVRSSGVQAVYIKATEGTNYTDPQFAANWQGAKEAGVLRGAYHFFRPQWSAVDQAVWFLNNLGDDRGELIPALDLETADNEPGGYILTWAQQWLRIVAAATQGRVLLYTSPGFWAQIAGSIDVSWAGSYPLWIAHYGVEAPTLPKPWSGYVLWQPGQGEVAGIAGEVDVDKVGGSLEDLKR